MAGHVAAVDGAAASQEASEGGGERHPAALANVARLAAFAFAASDLLAEVSLDGRIVFAAGAFRTRLGAPPESFIGQRVHGIVAPCDRLVMTQALGALAARGRLAPMVVRLADAAETPVALSGLAQPAPGGSWRLSLAFGPLPAPHLPHAAPLPAVMLVREAMDRLGEGPQRLDLIELHHLPALASDELAARVADALRAATGGGVLGEIAPGRYSVLRDGIEGDAGSLARATREALAADGLACEVEAHSLPIPDAAEGMGRALRSALAAYARDGWRAVAGAGFEQGLAGFLARSLSRRGELLADIAARRFTLAYQPIVPLAGGPPHHFEALLRLPCGEGTQEFVLAAEAAGLAAELDLAVLEAALGAAAAAAPGTRVAVNVSAISLGSPSFREALLRRLDTEPGAAARLAVEVTETAELDCEGEGAETAEAIRGRGVPFCIDDFGAGAAAFRHLRTLRADIVKVDGGYVRSATNSERDRAFVAAMVDLSLAVGAKVVAEQVETAETAEVMRGLGVELGQGWLFGRPAPLPAPQVAEPAAPAPRRVLLAGPRAGR